MTYAVLTDVFVRYAPIKTMVGSEQFDVSSVEVSSVFIAQAESYVDGWLARRYVVPLSTCPPLITQVTADLAIHAMLAEKTPQVPEWMDKRRDRAENILKMLAEGTMTLGSSVTAVSTGGDNYAWSNNLGNHPVFDPVAGELYQTPDIDQVRAAREARAADSDDSC